MIRECVGAYPVAHAGACMEMHLLSKRFRKPEGLLSLTPVIPLRVLSTRVVAEGDSLLFPRGVLFPIVAPGARLVVQQPIQQTAVWYVSTEYVQQYVRTTRTAPRNFTSTCGLTHGASIFSQKRPVLFVTTALLPYFLALDTNTLKLVP